MLGCWDNIGGNVSPSPFTWSFPALPHRRALLLGLCVGRPSPPRALFGPFLKKGPVMFDIDHVGINVTDLDRSVRFYTALFGTPPVERTSWRGDKAEYVAQMVQSPGATLDAAFFRIPGSNAILEVIQYGNLPEASGAIPRHYEPGAMHLGFHVKSIDDAEARIRAAGSHLLAEPVTIQHGPYQGTGGRAVLFQDPDGYNLQLMEVTSRPGGLPVPAHDS